MAVKFSPFRRLIKVIVEAGIYLESGFLELLSTAKCNEDTFKPALLHFDSATQSYTSSTPNPMQGTVNIDTNATGGDAPYLGEVLMDGQQSLAVGCAAKLPTVTDSCNNTYSNGGYCDPAIMYKIKSCMSAVPASVFSGKLRLLVQAIYGSTRTDYDCIRNVNGYPDRNYLILTVGGLNLSALYSPSSYGLITIPGATRDDFIANAVLDVATDVNYLPLIDITAVTNGDGSVIYQRDIDYTVTGNSYILLSSGSIVDGQAIHIYYKNNYRYYVAALSSTSITYYPIVLSSLALRMLGLIDGSMSDDLVKRVEAYALSTATFDANNPITGGSHSIAGSPLYYGWHWSWDGSQADIVTHAPDAINKYYIARHYSIVIAFNELAGTFVETVTEIASGNWSPSNNTINVFVPYPADLEMIAKSPIDPLDNPSGNLSNGCPLYCYYDDNDVLQSVSYTESIVSRSDITEYIENIWDNPTCHYLGQITTYYRHVYNGLDGDLQLNYGTGQITAYHQATSSSTVEKITGINKTIATAPVGNDARGAKNWTACDGTSAEDKLADYLIGGGTGLFFKSTGDQINVGGTLVNVYYSVEIDVCRYPVLRVSTVGQVYSGALFLEIPYNSSSAIFCGKRQINTAGTYQEQTGELISSSGAFQAEVRVVTCYRDPNDGLWHTIAVIDQFMCLYDEGGYRIEYNLPVTQDNYSLVTESVDVAVLSYSEEIATGDVQTSVYFDVPYGSDATISAYDYAYNATTLIYKYAHTYGAAGISSYVGDSAVGWV